MTLTDDYPWTLMPLITSAPMRLISTAPLAVAVSLAGGLGFLGAGTETGASLLAGLGNVEYMLSSAKPATSQTASTTFASTRITEEEDSIRKRFPTDILPVGVGIILHSASLADFLQTLRSIPRPPAAIWLFAARDTQQLQEWTTAIRTLYNPASAPKQKRLGSTPKIWIQTGTVADAMEYTHLCHPSVLVLQGTDAGGHGLQTGASIITLIPEVSDALSSLPATTPRPKLIAAGGIADSRGVSAALALGAEGVCMGTRYLASPEAVVSQGYRKEVVRADDGGVNTVRSRLYDSLRGTSGWPERYGGRGVVNASWKDAQEGMSEEDNKRLYKEDMQKGDAGWGPMGRITTYAGTAVGLVKAVKPAGDITREVREGVGRNSSRL